MVIQPHWTVPVHREIGFLINLLFFACFLLLLPFFIVTPGQYFSVNKYLIFSFVWTVVLRTTTTCGLLKGAS